VPPTALSERSLSANGWGFAGTSFPPPAALLSWLAERLGATAPRSAVDPTAVVLPAARPLPELPAAVSAEPMDRLLHARGRGFSDLVRLRSGRLPAAPDAVARPADAGEVEALIQACSRHGLRAIPWGGGTSVTGGVNTLAGAAPAVVVDLAGVAGLRRLDARAGLATFGGGTTGPALEASLAPHGLTLGHFPQSWELSTVGGWAATRSSGQESLAVGRIEELVAGLELVAPAGRLSLPALPASAAGPDLRRLALGSEGRLGVITEVTVRVRPRPAERRIEALLLPSWEAGQEAVRVLSRSGIDLQMLRLSDPAESEVALATGLGGHSWEPLARGWLRLRGVGSEACLLLVGGAGSVVAADEALDDARAFLRRQLGRGGVVSLGQRPGRRWLADRFRHPYLRDGLLDRGIATDTLETAAPWSALPGLWSAVRGALVGGLPGEAVPVLCHVSHVYPDGASLYFTFFFRAAADPEEDIARWAVLKRTATEALLAAGGTLSHHHGVGSWHAPWLHREVGEAGLRILRAAAREVDPAGVLNPHVLLDPVDRLEE
jgi:alkyldihydroxyacetonephosphate synthase